MGRRKRENGVGEGPGLKGKEGGRMREKGWGKWAPKTLILVPHTISVLFSGLPIVSPPPRLKGAKM